MFKKIFSELICIIISFAFVTASLSFDSSGNAQAAKVYETPSYYYEQLSDSAKDIYTALKKAVLECSRTVSVIISADTDDNDIGMIYELLAYHDPMTFNLKNIEIASERGRNVTFKLSYKYKKESYDKMVAAYEKETQKVLDMLTDDMSVYKKIRIIHDYIIKNTDYDMESSSNDNIYGTLIKNKGKCDGYSKTFSYICGQAGIRTVTVIGDDKMEKSDYMHMWNKVYYNKKWYNVDVTWDDPVGNIVNNAQYDFFMVSDDALKYTHGESNLSFEAPAADDDSKSYFVINKKYAEDIDSAKNILKKELISASGNNKSCVVLKCSSKELFEEVENYLKDPKEAKKLLSDVQKKTGSGLITDVYSYNFNEYQYIVSVYIFYKNTDLDDYFTTTDGLDSDALDTLAKYGID